jgi:hypothetical protein
MSDGLRLDIAMSLAVIFAVALGSCAHVRSDELDAQHELTLVDLANYRAALSGRPTADTAKIADPPIEVGFRELWRQSHALCGRRVTIQGRLERVFRQGAVASFPPLAEVWITSAAGDPFCIVFPQTELSGGNTQLRAPSVVATSQGDEAHADGNEQWNTSDSLLANERGAAGRTMSTPIPDLGRTVRFTGTFLKMVRYAAKDGKRLAPLIVGKHSPLSTPERDEVSRMTSSRNRAAEFVRAIGGSRVGRVQNPLTWAPASWLLALVLAILVAGAIAWQHLRLPVGLGIEQRRNLREDEIRSLEFIGAHDDV